jgi:hypothetical protein
MFWPEWMLDEGFGFVPLIFAWSLFAGIFGIQGYEQYFSSEHAPFPIKAF